MPQELLLGKHQLSELGSESAKIKAMGICSRVTGQYINTKTWDVKSDTPSEVGLNDVLCCRSHQTS